MASSPGQQPHSGPRPPHPSHASHLEGGHTQGDVVVAQDVAQDVYLVQHAAREEGAAHVRDHGAEGLVTVLRVGLCAG